MYKFKEIRTREIKEDTTAFQEYMKTEEFKAKKATADAIFASVFSQSWGPKIDEEKLKKQ